MVRPVVKERRRAARLRDMPDYIPIKEYVNRPDPREERRGNSADIQTPPLTLGGGNWGETGMNPGSVVELDFLLIHMALDFQSALVAKVAPLKATSFGRFGVFGRFVARREHLATGQ